MKSSSCVITSSRRPLFPVCGRCYSTLAVCVLALTLVACATTKPARPPLFDLPAPPSYIVACFNEAGVWLPASGDWTGTQASNAIGALVSHEGKLTGCGLDFLAWYGKLRTGLAAVRR